MERSLPHRLLGITPGEAEGQADTMLLLRRIGQAFEAGLPALLLREPRLCDREFLGLAGRVVELAGEFGGRWVGVHDRAHVAREVGADGLHLGFRSLTPASARRLLADDCAIGFSGHATDAPELWDGVDYITFGPLNDTPSKRAWLEATGLEGLGVALARATCPVFALGGIAAADVGPVLARGAAGVSVLSGILGAPDVARATTDYLAAFGVAGEA